MFDPNVDYAGSISKAKLPSYKDELFGGTFMSSDAYLNHANELAKGIAPVPQAQAYATLSILPTTSGSNVVEWPGLDPRSLKKICDENFAPQIITQMRLGDVLRYSQLSNHPWKPGWKVELMQGNTSPSDAQMRDKRDAVAFLTNCNSELGFTDTTGRDDLGLTSFQTFLAETVSNSMRFDNITTWTERDNADRIIAFAAQPSYLMRQCTRDGYNNKPEQYAVLLDETNKVQRAFTRKELIWTVRNPRTDQNVLGYGWPETEMATELIVSFQNALRLNASTFDKSAIPNGILLLKGDFWTQRQVDLLSRAWLNMKKGISKTWVLPAINVPKEGEMEILDLQDLKGTDVRYKDHMNMVASVFCALYGFPPQRLGYHPSGHTKDSEPSENESITIVGADDPGLPALLITLERHINQILWTRYPDLHFVFNGKNPKEDAREYEVRSQAWTLKERRAESDLPALKYPTEFKLMGQLMDMCPTDANQIGAFVSLASIALKAALGIQEGGEGASGSDETNHSATTGEKLDPAKSEAHGHTSGVRRDSAKEKGKKIA